VIKIVQPFCAHKNSVLCGAFSAMEITIRKAELRDVPALVALGRKTFFEKWKHTTSPENMSRYLDRAYSPDVIRAEIMRDKIVYLVAEANHEIVGYVRLTRDMPSIEEYDPGVSAACNRPLEVSRIYVSTELTGQSIGGRLINKVFELAKEEGCDLVWLGVWEFNEAVRFYQRHGFVKAGTHKFVMGDQVDTDWVMIKRV
jgi:ribosomal protein S18 acetylase RimI-like enzyme